MGRSPPPADMWLGGGIDRESWFRLRFQKGQLVEGAIRDDAGRAQGTVLVRVISHESTSTSGHLFQASYISASDSHYRWWMTEGGGKKLQSRGWYHSCEGNAADCKEVKPKVTMIHFEKVRIIGPQEWAAKTPEWAFKGSCRKDVETFDVQLQQKRPEKSEAVPLPWIAVEPEGVEDERSSSSEESGEDDTSEKIRRLRAKLAKLEAKTKGDAQKAKRKKKATSSPAKPKGDKKKKRKRSSDSPSRGSSEGGAEDKKKKKKKKSKAEKKDAAKKKRKRDASASEGSAVKRIRKKKAEESSSSSKDEGDEKLFTPGPKEAQEGVLPPKRGDRGPFGAGQPVDFNSEGSSDTEGDQVFREAPVQSSKSGQQALRPLQPPKARAFSREASSEDAERSGIGLDGGGDKSEGSDTSDGDALLSHHHGPTTGKQDEPSDSARTENVGGGHGSPGEKGPSAGSRHSRPENKSVRESDNRGALEHSTVLGVDTIRDGDAVGTRRTGLRDEGVPPRDEGAELREASARDRRRRKEGRQGPRKRSGRPRRRKGKEQEEERRGLGEPSGEPAARAEAVVSRREFARVLGQSCGTAQKAHSVLAEAWRALDRLDSPLGTYARSCKGSGVPPSGNAQSLRGDELLPLSPEVMNRFTALEPDKRDAMKLILATLGLLAMGGRFDPKDACHHRPHCLRDKRSCWITSSC